MKSNASQTSTNMRVALVVPHIFMHRDILPHVIFSPGEQALSLAGELERIGIDITLCTPGPVDTACKSLTADLSYFESELARRNDTYMDLLRKHPFTFITLARQLQSELLADVFRRANDGEYDLVHIYTNEEEIALPFSRLCIHPVVFTHHDPFNFLVKYKNNFPKYKDLNWLSLSYAQRRGMPDDTNWVGNISHGLSSRLMKPSADPSADYVAYIGRIIEPKGVHLAIAAVQKYNESAQTPIQLRIAGKHYSEVSKDTYWREKIEPELDDPNIIYEGYLDDDEKKQHLLANARALMVPSLFEEPFGMVTLEAFACATPVIALDSGALPEVIESGTTGIIVEKQYREGVLDELATVGLLSNAIEQVTSIKRTACRQAYEAKYTITKMAEAHSSVYHQLITSPKD